MPLHKIPAVYMRGGTSKAVMFRREDLPGDRKEWDPIFLAVIGAPDPYGRQLDGMGGGLSSLNKICVVGPPSVAGADVDYTFVQLSSDSAVVDYSGNCGNMSAAIGPFALEEGLVLPPDGAEAAVRIHNTNTGKIIVSRFPVEGGGLAAHGDFELQGVAGTGAPIRLEFVEPGGAKTGSLLPTGNAVDILDVAGLGGVPVSCVDAGNPAVFVSAASLSKTGVELSAELAQDAEFLARMESIRRQASVRMGLAPDLDAAARIPSIPKVAMVAAPADARLISGGVLPAGAYDLAVRMISVGQPHLAVPITGAICVAVAARIAGSIAAEHCTAGEGPIRIGHASGTTQVDAEVILSGDGAPQALHGAVYRSARRLFEGRVVYRA